MLVITLFGHGLLMNEAKEKKTALLPGLLCSIMAVSLMAKRCDQPHNRTDTD